MPSIEADGRLATAMSDCPDAGCADSGRMSAEPTPDSRTTVQALADGWLPVVERVERAREETDLL